MSLWTADDVEIDHCPSCRGLWFDANELSRHLAQVGGERLDEEPSRGAATTLRCPACPGELLLGSFLLDVPVESCPRCQGVFLDLGEVHELLGILHARKESGKRDASLSGFDNFALGLFVGMRRER